MAVLTEEQTMLRDSAREWAKSNAPVSAFRKMRDSNNELGFDKGTFTSVAEMAGPASSFRKTTAAPNSAIAASASCSRNWAARWWRRR